MYYKFLGKCGIEGEQRVRRKKNRGKGKVKDRKVDVSTLLLTRKKWGVEKN